MAGFLKNRFAFIVWAFVASFLAYASMYAFRKPFNAATYENLVFLGVPLKGVLVISQIVGYMCSKFIGIKVISELKKHQRATLIIGLILLAHTSLLLFAVVPVELKFAMLFLNGIPLGMVWGVIFSFLEGRKLTELIATGIAVGAILSSGLVKSFAIYLMNNPYFSITEFWMPFATGLFFLPTLLLSVWMLYKIPDPNPEDIAQKNMRKPMVNRDRKELFLTYFPGIASLVLLYVGLTVFRDFRDNYAVEIMGHFNYTGVSQFASMEMIIAGLVLITSSLTILFSNNKNGLDFCLLLFFLGFLLMTVSMVLFKYRIINPFQLMLMTGLGMSIGYVPYQIVVLERFIAAFKIEGNVGFLMYLSDSLGYLGSVFIYLLMELSVIQLPEYRIFEVIVWIASISGLCLSLFSYFYFKGKYSKKMFA
jgi:hypothetical protein